MDLARHYDVATVGDPGMQGRTGGGSQACILARVRVLLPALLIAHALSGCGSDPDPAFVPRGAGDYCEAIEPFFCQFYLRCGRMDVETAAECKEAFLTGCNGIFEPRYVDLEVAGLLTLDIAG